MAGRRIRNWLKSTSARTFVAYPAGVLAFELVRQRGDIVIVPWGVPLLVWGHLQYRWVGAYRTRRGGGGPGLAVPPDRIVQDGPYRYVRNPMYLGHLIVLLGLAVTFWSWLALALFLGHVVWFDRRVRRDEAHLERLFGAEYAAYKARVRRWIPAII